MIECDCSCSDFEPNRVEREIERRARKPHRCCECRELIKPGERYQYASGISADGYAYSFHTCLPCARIRLRYCSGGWIWGRLVEALYDCLGWDYRELPPDDDEQTEAAHAGA